MRAILIVDDDPDALALTQHALAKAGVKARLDVVTGRRRAIGYLKQRLARGENALPLLTFLDLAMPGTDGFAVLQWIRHQPRLRRLLRVVMSSSLRASALPGRGSSCAKKGVRSVFQLANAVLSIDEIEALVLPSLSPRAAVLR